MDNRLHRHSTVIWVFEFVTTLAARLAATYFEQGTSNAAVGAAPLLLLQRPFPLIYHTLAVISFHLFAKAFWPGKTEKSKNMYKYIPYLYSNYNQKLWCCQIIHSDFAVVRKSPKCSCTGCMICLCTLNKATRDAVAGDQNVHRLHPRLPNNLKLGGRRASSGEDCATPRWNAAMLQLQHGLHGYKLMDYMKQSIMKCSQAETLQLHFHNKHYSMNLNLNDMLEGYSDPAFKLAVMKIVMHGCMAYN